MEVAKRLVALLKDMRLTISSCESFTAGLFCAELAAISGASQVLRGGIVSYASDVKVTLAHVDDALIQEYGVISSQCAKAMASGANKVLQSDLCVSFTGNAGPSAMEGKPAGLCYIGICLHEETYVFKLFEQKKRNELRAYAVEEACNFVISLLEKEREGML